jgi:dUTPase
LDLLLVSVLGLDFFWFWIGFLCVLFVSHQLVNKGDRVAQLILTKIITPVVLEVEELDETVRGVGT